MAKRDAEGTPKKFSSKLLQMKFMQRAVAKKEAEAAPVTKVMHAFVSPERCIHAHHDNVPLNTPSGLSWLVLAALTSKLLNGIANHTNAYGIV